MPELPEVESVVNELNEEAAIVGQTVTQVEILSPKLRQKIPQRLNKKLATQKLLSITRRAKYILFEFSSGTLINHLGMTGSWRVETQIGLKKIKHDHFRMYFGHQKILVYNDPRRFGLLAWSNESVHNALKQSPYLKYLGVEPLGHDFSPDSLIKRAVGRSTNVKSFIMDQKNVVGVGNIYASECLFLAGISPLRKAGRIRAAEWVLISESISSVLRQAILSKGTTLKDYKRLSGEAGQFQSQLFVYGRKNEKCLKCSEKKINSTIRMKQIVGRSTYWCNICQK